MLDLILGILLAVNVAMPLDCDTVPVEDLGECRITEYCPACNEPYGYASASGVTLEPGHCACSWLPIGTVLYIEGERYEVVDICGTDAIDIFIDTDTCECDLNEYRHVYREGNHDRQTY